MKNDLESSIFSARARRSYTRPDVDDYIYHDKTHTYDQGKNSQRPRNNYPSHFACKLVNNNNNNNLSLWHTSN